MTTPVMTTFVRVEKGHADSSELAALTVALLAHARGRAHAAASATAHGHRPAGWPRRVHDRAYTSPASWRRVLAPRLA